MTVRTETVEIIGWKYNTIGLDFHQYFTMNVERDLRLSRRL